MDGECDKELEKVFVVATTDAVADPWTVVVHCVDACVAYATVGAAWGPVELTCRAPFHAHVDVIDQD